MTLSRPHNLAVVEPEPMSSSPATVAQAPSGGAPRDPRAAATRKAQRWLDALGEALPALFVSERIAALGGLSGEVVELLRRVGRIELATLDQEDKVRIEDGVLLVHRDYPEMLARRGARDGKLRTALYVAHEVAHLVQGIGPKTHVTELRAAEGEDTLLHLDLAADHAAAVVAAAAFDARFADLKRLSLRMLEDFPVGLDHSPGAALRKARRAVAIAAEIVARQRGDVSGESTYCYVHWGRGGAVAILMARGGFDRRVTTFEIDPVDAATFDAAAAANGSSRSLLAAMKRLLRAQRDRA